MREITRTAARAHAKVFSANNKAVMTDNSESARIAESCAQIARVHTQSGSRVANSDFLHGS
jgi:hypothetical protein